jgi:2-succinyl-6-hydroxy-2,4-cyclohexadiene-1-carboxylate synthase
MPIIEILGVPHAYELISPDRGSNNPVLVFIHGWLLSRNYWKPSIDRLSRDYPCLIYDLRGFGDSQPTTEEGISNFLVSAASKENSQNVSTPLTSAVSECDREILKSNYSLAAYAKDLRLLLQKLSIEKAWLIGHSLGGSIALWGAHYCEDIVQGAICLNSGGGIYIKEEFERFRAAGQQLIRRRPPWLSSLPLIDLLFARIMVARPLSSYWGRQRVLDFVKADERAALGSLLDSTTEAEVHLLPQLVARLEQPVYFIAGDRDRIMEPKYVRHLASFHKLFSTGDGNVMEIPNCGHLSMIEQPEIISSKIAKILMKHCIQ